MGNGTRKRGRFGAANHNWKGGRSVASNGCMLVRVGISHPLADVRGYAYEHRLVAAAKVGRDLREDERVHHVDGNKTNNDPANVEILTAAEHRLEHRRLDRGRRMPGEENASVSCACGCGSTFAKFDATGRPRRFVTGHNPRTSRGAVRAERAA